MWAAQFYRALGAFPTWLRQTTNAPCEVRTRGPFARSPVRVARVIPVNTVGCFPPSLAPESTVDRAPGYSSTRRGIQRPGNPPSPFPFVRKGGEGELGFPGVTKPHHRDGYRRHEESVFVLGRYGSGSAVPRLHETARASAGSLGGLVLGRKFSLFPPSH